MLKNLIRALLHRHDYKQINPQLWKCRCGKNFAEISDDATKYVEEQIIKAKQRLISDYA
jgi:hypothetical protein